MNTRILPLALAAAAALLAVAPAASAWEPIDPSQPVWDDLPVGYYINENSIPSSIDGIAVGRLDGGFTEWASPACTNFQAQNLGNTNSGSDFNDGQNVLRWQSGNWPQQLGDVNSVIGVTTPVTGGGGNLADADIIFNNVGFCWNDSGNGGCVDTGSIATHEEGHFLGLGHTQVGDATMYPAYGGGNDMRSIESDDQDGVCALYPEGGQQASSSNPGNCDSCQQDVVNGACAGAYNTCGQSQDCIDFYNCIQGCQSDACVNQCQQQNPNGASLYIDFVDCICDQCATECAMECGTPSSSSSSTGDAAAVSSSGAGDAVASSVGVGGAGVGPAGVGGSTGNGNNDNPDPDPLEVTDDSGCGCRMAGSNSGSLQLLGLAAGVAALAFTRRRRRR